jgi:Na+-transporting NADH:ubiquinone oxidoreductase subunit NqrC
MNHHPQSGVKAGVASRRGRQGSALMVVLVFLSLIAALVVSNSVMLHHLDRELRLLDRQQQRKFEPAIK